ncbi:MAG: hypothetical protein Edafosvirus4_37 [Edafosvirus sp.]|uniref:Uncharacterized protein n=1 Tax=Edafosvirus sp. TaxID=2487765 RepID=A0A3G4ZWS7_9VIRU|nr:MAG: hypothetical protein Edafosvirus4_37 [Edafosvirus sp.]
MIPALLGLGLAGASGYGFHRATVKHAEIDKKETEFLSTVTSVDKMHDQKANPFILHVPECVTESGVLDVHEKVIKTTVTETPEEKVRVKQHYDHFTGVWQQQVEVKERLKVTEKSEEVWNPYPFSSTLLNPSFGVPHLLKSPSLTTSYINRCTYPVESTYNYGHQMSPALLSRYGVNVSLHPHKPYWMKYNSLRGKSLYFSVNRWGPTAYEYTDIAEHPTTVAQRKFEGEKSDATALQILSGCGIAVGVIGAIAAASS